jgi:hypothetical protein
VLQCWFALAAICCGHGVQSFAPPLKAAGTLPSRRDCTRLNRQSREGVSLRVRGGEPHEGPPPMSRDGELSPDRAAEIARSAKKIVVFDQTKNSGVITYETGQRYSRKESAVDRAVANLDKKIPAKKGTFSYAHLKPTAPATHPSTAPIATTPAPAKASSITSPQPVSVLRTGTQPIGLADSQGTGGGRGRGGSGGTAAARASAIPVTVKHAFAAQSEDELSLSKGAVIYVYPGEVEPGWYFAEGGGGRGLVPSTHFDVSALDA